MANMKWIKWFVVHKLVWSVLWYFKVSLFHQHRLWNLDLIIIAISWFCGLESHYFSFNSTYIDVNYINIRFLEGIIYPWSHLISYTVGREVSFFMVFYVIRKKQPVKQKQNDLTRYGYCHPRGNNDH